MNSPEDYSMQDCCNMEGSEKSRIFPSIVQAQNNDTNIPLMARHPPAHISFTDHHTWQQKYDEN
jgi:hypothetical protein